MDNLIKADTITYEQNIDYHGSGTNIQLSHVYVLNFVADASFNTPFKFAPAWNHAVSSFGGDQLYRMLFTQLTQGSGISPDSLVIRFKFTDLFSFLVYYNNDIKISKVLINVRDGDIADSGMLDDICYGGMFVNVPAAADLDKKLFSRLEPALKTYKHTKEISVVQEYSGHVPPAGMVALTVNNINGEVTGNRHENISINIFISPSGEPGHINMYYLFYVFYASGFAEPAATEYRNAMPDYVNAVREYGLKLNKVLHNAIY